MVRISVTQFIVLSLLSSSNLIILVYGDHVDHDFVKVMDPEVLGLKKQKLSHLQLYWHDILSGKNLTAVKVVASPGNSSTLFGLVRMIDDPLTEKPEMSSKEIGRAQGFYASAAQQEQSLLMSMSFHFTQGKLNGSTLTVMGRNPVFEKVREMPVTFTPGTGDAIVEYNCYVLHY